MSTTPNSKLFKLVEGLDLPDLKQDYRLPLPLTMKALSASGGLFTGVLTWLTEEAKGGRSSADTAKLRDAMRLILMNFTDAMFTRKWTVFHGDKSCYGKGSHYDKLFLGFNRVQDCLRVLEENELIDKRRGYIDTNGIRISNKYFPTAKLQSQIWMAYLDIEEEIKPPYVFNKHDQEIIAPDEIKEMTIINDFMKDHSWASKGPITLRYKIAPMEGGRIYTHFQTLPMNKIPIRINTSINGNPIVEVDYKANHLRMAIACKGKNPPPDPYLEILDTVPEAKTRERVKQFVTRSLGSTNEETAFNACKEHKINRELFNKLKDATQKIYSDIGFFNPVGFGTVLQSSEGQIARQLMLNGVEAGIPALPIHDAFAVEKQNCDWLVEQMKSIWNQNFSCEAAVEITRPML